MSTPSKISNTQAITSSEMNYRQAIQAALADELRTDNSVILLGEDIGAAGGSFKTTEGLLDEFGAARVMDTPIAENSFVGAALGMAVTGMRPVVEIMFSDFLLTAADALMNEVSKFRYMSGGQAHVPLTIRAIGGATGRFGSQHSATGESWFMQSPGLLIVTASSPASAYSLLRASIRLEDPVLFIEHKGMYSLKGPVDRSVDLPQVGKAEIVRAGHDVTIVSTLLMVQRSLQAAENLASEHIQAEVIDLRWITPLDIETICQSIARTKRLLIVEEQVHAGGWGATIISMLAQQGLLKDITVRTVSMPFTSVAFSPLLEDAALPDVDQIAAVVRSLVN